MCQHHNEFPHQAEFAKFSGALRRWLADSPELDPALAAAIDLFDRPLPEFECEVAHIAWNAEDMHSALGAAVVLSLWNGHKSGQFTLPSTAWDST